MEKKRISLVVEISITKDILFLFESKHRQPSAIYAIMLLTTILYMEVKIIE